MFAEEWEQSGFELQSLDVNMTDANDYVGSEETQIMNKLRTLFKIKKLEFEFDLGQNVVFEDFVDLSIKV